LFASFPCHFLLPRSAAHQQPLLLQDATESHLFSLYFILPFLAVSLALFWHNK
jgi:hypothetical protein